ncbi:hypothetical protein C1637_10005 [Chryseobacterium lactis]|uniref:Lipoprotein n=1 Tax=Chryseobacterium lactis TaxID=1241981 RepID=A0A3G6RL12_CHRLC|nr:hypothetical protein [Chryseobacterium lactis]AZA82155.1 hypothetical protein EG342_09690 [Chryseobacterium lactis]AZB02536.1 hypothetical protein EG341_00545 [Chryseobacterium lactis]PNW14168.1 hypothetical protein C1637_10005 [Chryseobacterium lactis]
MRATILALISLFVLGCGSRTKNLTKTEDHTRFENNSNLNESTSLTNSTSSVADVRNFLINNGLKIKSTGQNYELRYGDLVFSGSADLEFTEKKEETIIHHVYKIHTTYIKDIKYQTKTFFKTDKTSKNLNVKRTGVSFGSMVWIVIFSLISGVILWELAKRIIFRK